MTEPLISQEEAIRYRDERDAARNEVDRLTRELARYRATVTAGGPPPGYHQPGAWRNETHAPPPSASNPDAPPLESTLSSRRHTVQETG